MKALEKSNTPQKAPSTIKPQIHRQPIPQFSRTEKEIELENQQLHNELVHVTGNYKVADELLKKKRKQYPRKTETWCLKQLINELKGESQPQTQPTKTQSERPKTQPESIPKTETKRGDPLPNLKDIKYPKPENKHKNKQLQRELLIMLGGNREVANRLVSRQKQLNPGKTEFWYLEKVIFDLKRDRGI
ncbi:hypothetical protein WJM97_13515 [Okeanomitos corallinicola TIOX110]|uniref:Uncharacterized protein n=1 Tax=Okeanomitos corallinicola TIOX110 TaxID=3133117 RepID=A0ABZ2UM42_9CYAN